MQMLREVFEFFLHIDDALKQLTSTYGNWTYAILGMVIFCETGLVITPFLPGDSLLFAAGAIAADPTAGLSPVILYLIVTVMAILGDSVNYTIGSRFGVKIFDLNLPFVKREYLDRANAFYAKHGAKMIVMARFVPIVRTFAPFAAGIAKMDYKTFITYNVVGGFVWTTLFVWAGYFFGNLPFVQNNFELVALAIVVLSIVPIIFEWIQARGKKAE